MGRKIDAIHELFIVVALGFIAIGVAWWIEFSILNSDLRFLVLKLIGFILPFTFLAILSTRANIWSFRKQAIMAAIFSLVLLAITVMTVTMIVSDGLSNEGCIIALIIYAALWLADNGMFISYVRHLKRTSAKYACRNRIIYCLEKNAQRHARLTAGIFVQDEKDFLIDVHLVNADPDIAVAALEGPAFASWISKRYNNDHRAALNSVLKTSTNVTTDESATGVPDETEEPVEEDETEEFDESDASGVLDKPPNEPDKSEP